MTVNKNSWKIGHLQFTNYNMDIVLKKFNKSYSLNFSDKVATCKNLLNHLTWYIKYYNNTFKTGVENMLRKVIITAK